MNKKTSKLKAKKTTYSGGITTWIKPKMTKTSRPMGGPTSNTSASLKKGTAKKTRALNTTIKTGLPTLQKRTTAPRTKTRKGLRKRR